MHLVETYALNCGLKIDSPHVYEHYMPIPFEKFISFNRRAYPYFLEVINLIKPELDKRNIKIVQLKTPPNGADVDVSITEGPTFGQWAYFIKHSLLHFGEDDVLFDLAAYYNVPRVILFSNTYPANFKPYWGDEGKQRILFDTGPHSKPTFSADVNANFVYYIKPEVIAQNIMDLLGIPWSPPYDTVYAGKQYRPQHDFIEIVPDKTQPIELNGRVATMAVRMDYNFDEQFLVGVLEKAKISIVTAQPITPNIFQLLRNNILEIAYIVSSDSDVGFAQMLAKMNLPYSMLAFEHSTALKERFFEIGAVTPIITHQLDKSPELKNGLSGMHYKSAKRLLHGKKEYKGKYDFVNQVHTLPNEFSPCPPAPNQDFLHELEYMLIVKLRA